MVGKVYKVLYCICDADPPCSVHVHMFTIYAQFLRVRANSSRGLITCCIQYRSTHPSGFTLRICAFIVPDIIKARIYHVCEYYAALELPLVLKYFVTLILPWIKSGHVYFPCIDLYYRYQWVYQWYRQLWCPCWLHQYCWEFHMYMSTWICWKWCDLQWYMTLDKFAN